MDRTGDTGERTVRPGAYSIQHAVRSNLRRATQRVLNRSARRTAIHWQGVFELTMLGAGES